MTESKRKNTKMLALMGLVTVVAISTGILSINAFSTTSTDTEITFTDTPMVRDGVTSVAHYELTHIDKPELKDGTPARTQSNQISNTPLILGGGMITMEWFDADRNLIAVEKTHNRLVDTGETFLLQQVFQDGTIPESADADLMSSICVTAEGSFADTDETETASTFDSADGLTETNCIEDSTVSISAGVATIGALTFDAPTHVGAGDTITGIGICQGSASTPFTNCADAQAGSSGILLATGDTNDRTLQSSETVDITYNFDMATASS